MHRRTAARCGVHPRLPPPTAFLSCLPVRRTKNAGGAVKAPPAQGRRESLSYDIDGLAGLGGFVDRVENAHELDSALGGSLGALLGMWLFRHKTRKAKFFVTVPLVLAAQCALLYWLSVH